jgi:hypothetical protein
MLRIVRQLLLVPVAFAGLIPAAVWAQPEVPARWPSLEGGGAYVLFLDNNVTIVNGSPSDYQRGKAQRQTPTEPLFWFQRAGKEYVLRDPVLMKKLQAIFQPQMSLGQQQSSLNARQASLDQQQEALGAQFEDLGAQQAEYGERMSQLAMEQARLQEAGEDTSSVDAEMQGLEQEMTQFEQPQADLSRQQDEINQSQELLQRQQQDLNQKQEKAVQEAERQLKSLVDQALAKGLAKALK